MSLELSIKRVRKPIAKGLDRVVYYSKRYDLIIKKQRNFPRYDQFNNELSLFQSLQENEKYLFPVVAFYEELKTIVMRKARMLNDREREAYRAYNRTYNPRYLKSICSNAKEFANFTNKYGIEDLHSDNVGIINGQLVVIDAGLCF